MPSMPLGLDPNFDDLDPEDVRRRGLQPRPQLQISPELIQRITGQAQQSKPAQTQTPQELAVRILGGAQPQPARVPIPPDVALILQRQREQPDWMRTPTLTGNARPPVQPPAPSVQPPTPPRPAPAANAQPLPANVSMPAQPAPAPASNQQSQAPFESIVYNGMRQSVTSHGPDGRIKQTPMDPETEKFLRIRGIEQRFPMGHISMDMLGDPRFAPAALNAIAQAQAGRAGAIADMERGELAREQMGREDARLTQRSAEERKMKMLEILGGAQLQRSQQGLSYMTPDDLAPLLGLQGQIEGAPAPGPRQVPAPGQPTPPGQTPAPMPAEAAGIIRKLLKLDPVEGRPNQYTGVADLQMNQLESMLHASPSQLSAFAPQLARLVRDKGNVPAASKAAEELLIRLVNQSGAGIPEGGVQVGDFRVENTPEGYRISGPGGSTTHPTRFWQEGRFNPLRIGASALGMTPYSRVAPALTQRQVQQNLQQAEALAPLLRELWGVWPANVNQY